jgi:gliding motility-associated-like protein
LTITANNQVKCQGVAFTFANTQFTSTGLVNGDVVNGVSLSSAGSPAAALANGSPYAIVPSAAVGNGLSNYNIVYVNGSFTVNPLPVFTVTSPSNFICGATANLTLTATGGVSYQWFRNNTAISGAAAATFSATQAGTYTATATTAQGCTATSSNSLVITQLLQPTANFTFDSYCINRSIQLNNQSAVSNSGTVSYAWSDNVGNLFSTTNPSATYASAGNYAMKLRVQSSNCPNLADSITSVIPVEAPRVAIRQATLDVAIGDNVPLQARTFGTQYTWTPGTGLSNSFISNPIVNLNAEQDYRITIRVPSGCTTVDSLKVRVQEKNTVYVPNVFSPNGDGMNDKLLIIPVGVREIKYFRIFNRNGKKLFETADINGGWDGTFNGQLQPLATYVWQVLATDKNGNNVYREGSVTLLR